MGRSGAERDMGDRELSQAICDLGCAHPGKNPDNDRRAVAHVEVSNDPGAAVGKEIVNAARDQRGEAEHEEKPG